MRTTAGTKYDATPVGQPLHGRSAPLRVADHFYNLCQRGLGTNAFRAHHETSGAVDRSADHPCTQDFLDGNRFAGDQRFVDGTAPVSNDSIPRDFFAGPYAHQVSHLKMLDRYVDFSSVVTNQPRSARRQLQQRANRGGCLAARPQFEHLPEQYQRGDCSRRLEINGDFAMRPAKCRRKDLREENRNQAVEVSRSSSESDQREHVQTAVHDRRPASLEKWPPGPQHHRRGENQPNPADGLHRNHTADRIPGDHVGHTEKQNGDRECDAHPKAPRHRNQFRILFVLRYRGPGFQCHAADRARPRAIAHDFRMHGAGVFNSGG
jgi:hypothetical protein